MKLRSVLPLFVLALGIGFGFVCACYIGGRFPLSPAAKAQVAVPARIQACAAELLQGSYSLTLEGTIVTVSPGSSSPPGPYAALGIVNFDGRNSLSLNSTQSYNGVILSSGNVTGTYTLNSTCGGRITLSSGAVFDLIINNTGREAHLIQLNTGSVIQGTLRKL